MKAEDGSHEKDGAEATHEDVRECGDQALLYPAKGKNGGPSPGATIAAVRDFGGCELPRGVQGPQRGRVRCED